MRPAYAVVFEYGPGNLGVYVPDLPGCFGVGDALEKTHSLMKEAIAFHIDIIREQGETTPEPRTSISEALAKHNENLPHVSEGMEEDPPERPVTVQLVEVDTSPDAIAQDYGHLEKHDIRPSPRCHSMILGRTASR